MAETTVIYHKSDFDGIFCREIAKLALGSSAEYIGWDYGDPIPLEALVPTLYILDLSIPELMNHPNLIWIDHHISAIKKYNPNITGLRLDGVAACRLTYQWFFGDKTLDKSKYINREVNEPLAVRLAGEYDIWDKRDPRADLFQHGLRSENLSDSTWTHLLLYDEDDETFSTVERLLKQARVIEYFRTAENKRIIETNGFDLDFEGLTFLACNHASFNSLLFTAGIKPHHDALFGFRFNGKLWKISLYQIPGKDIDLSVIAAKYGGGGHRAACGFEIHDIHHIIP